MKHFVLTIASLLLCLFCYSQNNKTINPTLSSDTSLIKADSLIIDSAIKEKICLAFALLQKYTKESLVYPKELSDRVINCYHRVSVGTIQVNTSGDAKITTSGILPNDLIVFVDNIKRDSTDHVGKVYRFQDSSKAVVTILADFIKENSVEIVASVLFHELIHFTLMESGLYQSLDEDSLNEYIAYSNQLNFLYYVYGGPEIERRQVEKQLNAPGPTITVPWTDMKNFVFFSNQCKRYYPK